MRYICTAAASAALILGSMPVAHAEPRRAPETPAARVTIEEIDGLAGQIADKAFELNRLAMRKDASDLQLEGLDHIRDEINTVGKDLALLEAERASLPAWEAEAVDRTVPRMHEAAENAGRAIQSFNADKGHLWTTPYMAETASIEKDSRAVATMLHEYLKLESTRASEQKLTHELNTTD